MKHVFLLLMALVLTFTLFVACEEENTDEPMVTSLVPIKLGNTWTYRETNKVTQYGNEVHIDTFSQTVVGPYTVNGVDYLSIEDSQENFEMLGQRFFYGNDDQGNMMFYGGISSTDTLILNSIYMKKNVTAGESWTTSVAYFDEGDQTFKQSSYTFKCVSSDTLITTPGGSFHCKVFEDLEMYEGLPEEDFFLMRIYVADNVGLIKIENFEFGELYGTRELISYHLH